MNSIIRTGQTQVSLSYNGIIVEENKLNWIEEELESEYGFDVSIYFSNILV